MNILYLAHRLPYPPNKGDKLRAFHQIADLSRRHHVWCACFVDDPKDYAYVSTLRKYCHELATVRLRPRLATIRGLAGLARGKALTPSYYEHRSMHRILADWSTRITFDVVMAFSSSMAPYAIRTPCRRRVLDFCDLDSVKWTQLAEQAQLPLRWLYRVEGRRLAELERKWIDKADATILISHAERDQLSRDIDRRKVHVVGNGVEVSALPTSQAQPPLSPNDSPIVGFMGVMNYQPNIEGVAWFVRRCWPIIRREIPTAQFHIVGRSPHRKVRQLANGDGVRVVGEVTDARQAVSAFDVSVAPLQVARGLQNKVLEAMACGKPVVLTRKAAEGINGLSGQHFLASDDPGEFAHAVISLLQQPQERQLMGQRAKQYVSINHQWPNELKKLELIVTSVSDIAKSKPQALMPQPSPQPAHPHQT